MQHRALGRILGYPECCIDAFLEGPEQAARHRGTIFVRYRTPEERETLKIQARIIAGFEGLPDEVFREVEYVPCEAHIGSSGWRAWP